MLWRLGAGLGTLIVVLVGVGLILPEDRFMYFSSRVLAGTPADLGLAYREVWFEADDGAALHGWWVRGARVRPHVPLRPFLRTRFLSLAKVPALRMPLLVLHSPTDEVVPYAQGEELSAAAPNPKRFHATGGGAGHNDSYLRGDAYWQVLGEFLASLEA